MVSTYVLRCCDNRYYIGSTINLDNRIKEHGKGKCCFTKSRLPVILIYYENFASLGEARRREIQLKKFKSRQVIEKLLK